MRTALPALAAAGVLLAGVAAGCGGGEKTTQSEANTALCTSGAALQTALDQLKGLTKGNVTKDQLTAIAASISTAWSGFKSALDTAGDVDSTAVKNAWNDTVSAIKAIPGNNQSLQQDLQSVQATLPALQQALKGLTPDCPSTGTTGTSTSGTTTS